MLNFILPSALLHSTWNNGPPRVTFDQKMGRDIPRFLNRLLGMQLDDQKLLFDYFASTLDAVTRRAKSQVWGGVSGCGEGIALSFSCMCPVLAPGYYKGSGPS